MARRPRPTDETLIELFLDMLAAERGASANTLDAYRRDLDRFFRRPRRPRTGASRPPAATTCARISARLEQARPRRGLGGAAAVGDPPALSLPLQRGPSRRRSGRGDRGAEARPQPAEGAVGQAGRRSAGAGATPATTAERRCRSGCAPRGSPACSRCSTPPACASPSWWRCRRPRRGATSACWWCAARAAASGWCRSTTPPSAPWPTISRCAREAKADRNRNGCSRRSARAAT